MTDTTPTQSNGSTHQRLPSYVFLCYEKYMYTKNSPWRGINVQNRMSRASEVHVRSDRFHGSDTSRTNPFHILTPFVKPSVMSAIQTNENCEFIWAYCVWYDMFRSFSLPVIIFVIYVTKTQELPWMVNKDWEGIGRVLPV